jgi:DNA repair protein RadA/Sms
MSKPRTVFRCAECGGEAPKWAGRCPACGEWNSLTEEAVVEPARVGGSSAECLPLLAIDTPVPIAEVVLDEWRPLPTGDTEVDRVLSGGLVPGSVTLIGGEPGVGKSTLLLQLLSSIVGLGRRCLYVSAEESKQQVRLRAERLGTLRPDLWLAADTVVPHVLAHVAQVRPEVLVVDSVQTVFTPDLSSAPGSVAQVRESAAQLVRLAKSTGLTVILVGHVTKEGGLAGPRVLEHMVDTVLSFQGDRHHALRLLRADKHRFGATDELGVFEMSDRGLQAVPDPSGLFLADRRAGVAGSVVTATVEGHRPLLLEVQALAASSSLPSPRRSAQGLDQGRLAVLLAVLEQRVGIRLDKFDVYALAVGGAKAAEPGVDLALALAVVSSITDRAVAPDVVAVGEVGLGGELRQVSQIDRRLAEAARLGFRRAIVPWLSPDPPAGLVAVRARTLAEALAAAEVRSTSVVAA